MSTRGIGVAVIALGLSLGVVGCSGRAEPPKFEGLPVRVTCTTTIVADVVRRVGGDRVKIETIMGAGIDPHKYLAAAGDRKMLDDAHLVFFNGLHLEGKMADLFEKNADRWRAQAITQLILPDELRKADVDGGEHDPHVWFDVKLWRTTVGAVAAHLVMLDPDGAQVYADNAAAYVEELNALDKEIRVTLATVPQDRRVLVTSHDAFGYFGRAYGFRVIGLQGVSTASETGTSQRADLAKLLGSLRIPAVFTETSVPSDSLKAVLDDVRKDYKYEVKLIGGDDALYSDALGEPGSPGATYPGMIRHNVSVIVNALAP